MFRFTTMMIIAVLWLGMPASAIAKNSAPPISVCYGDVCLMDLRWSIPDGLFGNTSTAVSGTLVNGSSSALRTPGVNFTLHAGDTLVGTAADFFSGTVPPGGRWRFHAVFSESHGGRLVMSIHNVVVSYTAGENGGRRTSETLDFDPLFAPYAWHQRRAWEKLHGKRQR
jgi:hypothetical protein